jgi:hypothetical protein
MVCFVDGFGFFLCVYVLMGLFWCYFGVCLNIACDIVVDIKYDIDNDVRSDIQ